MWTPVKTHTPRVGTVFWQVWVQVLPKVPRGYLCISLAAEPTQNVDTVPEPSDHGLYEDPLVGSQYTSEGEDYPLEAYEEYSNDGDGE